MSKTCHMNVCCLYVTVTPLPMTCVQGCRALGETRRLRERGNCRVPARWDRKVLLHRGQRASAGRAHCDWGNHWVCPGVMEIDAHLHVEHIVTTVLINDRSIFMCYSVTIVLVHIADYAKSCTPETWLIIPQCMIRLSEHVIQLICVCA